MTHSGSPLFSILMPTRNRAHLLPYAVQSVLEQGFNDYEVIVSDNHSDDETEKIIRPLTSDKVRYFRTDGVLSMPDNFEFALSKARGQWIMCLADDDAYCPSLLTHVADVLQRTKTNILSWHSATYWHDTYGKSFAGNQLMLYPFSGLVERFDTRPELEGLFTLNAMTGRGNQRLPRMINSCCSMETIHAIKKRAGRFFIPPAPDYSTCAAMLSLENEYAYLDIPLMLSGKHDRGSVVITFPQEFGDESLFRHVPLRLVVSPSVIAESLLRVKEAMPELVGELEIGWVKYWIRSFREIPNTGRRGANVQAERKEFFSSLAKQPLITRAAVISGIWAGRSSTHLRTLVRRLIDHSRTLTSVEESHRRRLVQGADAGFRNIVEAARYVERVEQ